MRSRNHEQVLALLFASLLVFSGLGAGVASAGGGESAGNAPTNDGDAATYHLQQGDRCIPIEPIQTSESASAFYDWNVSETQYSSAGTGDLQRANTSTLFLHEDADGTVSLVVLHGSQADESSAGGAATFTLDGMPSSGTWAVQDDRYDGSSQYDTWDTEGTTHEIDWTWNDGRTDGGVYEGIGDDVDIQVDPAFNQEAALYGQHYEGDVTDWNVLSGDRSNPNRTALDMDQPVHVRTGPCSTPDETDPGNDNDDNDDNNDNDDSDSSDDNDDHDDNDDSHSSDDTSNGAANVTVTNDTVEITITDAEAGSPVDVDLPTGDTPAVSLDRLNVTTANDTERMVVTAELLGNATGNTSDATLPTGLRSVDYLELSHDAANGTLGNVTIEFTVEQTALTSDADPADVGLTRYNTTTGEVDQIETHLQNETSDGYRYNATLSAFSTFAVVEQVPAFAVESAGESTTVAPDEDVTVTATITNEGRAAGSYRLPLLVDGERVDTQQVQLDPGETTEITTTHSFDEPGQYRLAVGTTDVRSVTVEAQAAQTATSQPDDPATDATAASGPGFGVPLALVALLAATLAVLGRRTR